MVTSGVVVTVALMALTIIFLSSIMATLYRKAGPHEALIVYQPGTPLRTVRHVDGARQERYGLVRIREIVVVTGGSGRGEAG